MELSVNRADVTVLGAAMLAGVGAGVFASVEKASELLPAGRIAVPAIEPAVRIAQRERWRRFVEASAQL